MALGRRNPADRDERFSMAVLALKTSAYRNAVSRLHRNVSQEMFHDLWPQLPVWEVPITSITNGVHAPSWLNADLAALYDQYLQPDWRERFNDPTIWEQVNDIPGEELLEAHRRRKRRLVAFVRERQQFGGGAAAGAGDRGAACERSARSERVHHRLRAPLRDLQARHAAVPRRRAAEAHPVEQGNAGADRDRRQGASQGPAGQELHPRDRPAFARSRICGSTWSSWKTTT
jgi:hypothetical protein